jgi:hypothetical protein
MAEREGLELGFIRRFLAATYKSSRIPVEA